MQKILERCFQCWESKAILKELYVYRGKSSYICKDCDNLRVSLDQKIKAEVIIVPSFLKH